MSEELKPCPFCESKRVKYVKNSFMASDVAVECQEVDCGGQSSYCLDEEQAAEYWNHRPVEDALRAELKQRDADAQGWIDLCNKNNVDALDAVRETQELRAEVSRLQGEKIHYPDGEHHCACVQPLEAEVEKLKAALAGLLDTIDGATSADLHHHQCPKYARFGSAEYICDCGADKAEEKARAALEED